MASPPATFLLRLEKPPPLKRNADRDCFPFFDDPPPPSALLVGHCCSCIFPKPLPFQLFTDPLAPPGTKPTTRCLRDDGQALFSCRQPEEERDPEKCGPFCSRPSPLLPALQVSDLLPHPSVSERSDLSLRMLPGGFRRYGEFQMFLFLILSALASPCLAITRFLFFSVKMVSRTAFLNGAGSSFPPPSHKSTTDYLC